jgi:hypothetical protein
MPNRALVLVAAAVLEARDEASWPPCRDDGRPGRIVHDGDRRRDRDRAATTGLVTQVGRGAGRKEQDVIGGARAPRPVQVLGRCATRSTFDQQSDRVGLVLLPGGEAWIAAGKRLDFGAVLLLGPVTANAPVSLMLFQVVSIQPSERWTWAIRNSSMWPLKGSAMPLTCRPM